MVTPHHGTGAVQCCASVDCNRQGVWVLMRRKTQVVPLGVSYQVETYIEHLLYPALYPVGSLFLKHDCSNKFHRYNLTAEYIYYFGLGILECSSMDWMWGLTDTLWGTFWLMVEGIWSFLSFEQIVWDILSDTSEGLGWIKLQVSTTEINVAFTKELALLFLFHALVFHSLPV